MPDAAMEIRVDDRAVKRELKRLGAAAEDGTKPLGQFYAAWKLIVNREWSKITMRGGKFRGQRWKAAKAQYTRKDGTVVPAWGGVPKVRGTGNVKARKRPSGARVSPTQILNQDTKALARDILTARPNIRRKRALVVGTAVKYAPRVLVELKRNPLFWKLPEDQNLLKKAGEAFLHELATRFNRAR